MNYYNTDVSYSQLMHEGLLKFMHEGLLVLNSQNQIASVNDSALNLLGYSTGTELLGKHVREIYAFPDALENLLALQNEGETIDNWENTFIRSDGNTFTGSYSIRVIDNANQLLLMKMILFRDITEAKKSAQVIEDHTKSLEKSNKELDQFAYIVSHDLKAPLRAISNLSVWLQEDLGDSLSDESKTNLTMLRGRVLRMESLINGILEYSRVGRAEMPSESIDTAKLISEVVELLAPPSHIKLEVYPEMPTLEAPKIMLLQIFSNLISNAIKYNDKKEGLIKISAVEKESAFEFTVEDNGPGIDPEYHEKIFVIFQTLQSRDKFESTGIGLTIVKRILQARGGHVWVESAPGKGSKFIFTWPK
jgi:PAS domain S-box-containing protein